MPAPGNKVVLRGPSPVTNARIKTEEVLSFIELQKDDIIRRLQSGTGAEIVTADLTNIMLQSVVNILPSLEKAALASPRGVYPLEKLLGMARELAHDARVASDRNVMREKIMNGIIDPALIRFAQKQITALNQLARKLHKDEQAVEHVAKMRDNVAETVNDMRVNVSNTLDSYFGGDGDAKGIVPETMSEESAYTPDDGSVAQALADAEVKASRTVKKKGYFHAKRRS